MSFSLAQPEIISLIIQYKYAILIPIIAIEGPVATVLAGLLVSMGYMNFFGAYAVIIVGDMAGDSLYFALGYWGREKLIRRWGKFLGITIEKVERLEKHFRIHSGKTLIVGKLSHVFGLVILLAAGLAKMSFKDFFKFDLLATIPKSLILIFTGYYFGKAAIRSIQNFDSVALQTFFIVVLLIVIYFAIRGIAEKFLKNNRNI
jgi:membrane protein DedA with SNARE-associated domain